MPARGYHLFWRVVGSGDPYTDGGSFFSSPIVFTDETNPFGTEYEGTIRSENHNSICDDIYWSTIIQSGGSGSSGGGVVCKQHEFSVFGPDSDQYRVTGLNCNGTSYNSGLRYVGDGGLSVCLQVGTYAIENFGTGGAVLQNADNDCSFGFFFLGCGRGNSAGEACADAVANSRVFWSYCSSIAIGCRIYTGHNLNVPLTGYSKIFIENANWDINPVTAILEGFSSEQC